MAGDMKTNVLTVGRLSQVLDDYHDATPVWVSEGNLLYRVEVAFKETAAGRGIVLTHGDKVSW